MRCDASGYAIGAELAQEIEGSWRTVGLFSRKLGKSQLNWTPREKETYAIVAALQKWAGTIGFQPVTVTTDHRALESWVTEHVDTPSGPRGRRARWHETLSQFDLEVKYIPGPENAVADALSRWAYPASSAREDVSFHGSAQAKEEVDNIIKEEQTLARMVGVLRRRRPAHEEKEREESSKGQEGKVGNPPDHVWQSKEEKGIRKGYPVSQGLPESAGRGHQEGQEEPEGEGGPEEAAPAAGPQPDQKSYPITQPCPVWRADTRGRREKGETPQQVSPITLRSGRRTQEEENEEGGTPQQLTTPEKGGFLHRKGEPNPRPKFTFSRRRGKVGGAPTEEVNRNPEEASSSTQLPRMVTRRGGSPPPERREPDGPRPVIPPTPLEQHPHIKEEEPERGSEGEFILEDPELAGEGEFILEEPELAGEGEESEEEAGEQPAIPLDQEIGPPEANQPTPLPLRFRFSDPVPLGRPVTDVREELRRRGRTTRLPPRLAHPIPSWEEECAKLLQEDWGSLYEECPELGGIWEQIFDPEQDWPKGYQLYEGKIMFEGRLCVPIDRTWEVIEAHHVWNAHQGVERLIPDLNLHYKFVRGTRLAAIAARVRQECQVCQACLRPNWALKGPISMTPILPRVMASVCLDIFAMPMVEWDREFYNGILLCVDRHSGWIVARPKPRHGLTGRQAANLMLDTSWGEMGIPSVITSDQGSQFVSQWWQTMCCRLGVRQAFSQAYRPQANGRAEVAGGVLQGILQRLNAQRGINWVEALPRALRIHHDAVDPIMGMSPYQAIFGRQRSLAALPWEGEGESEEAIEFFERMAFIDKEVAQVLEGAHERIAERVNAHRQPRPPFQVGDWVFLLKPKPIGGVKLSPWWLGPYLVLSRVGEHSYQIKLRANTHLDVHVSQLKFCHWEGAHQHVMDLHIPPLPTDPVYEREEE